MLAVGSLVEDRYELQTLVHTSRDTRVFKAADRITGAPVVVKFFSKVHYQADLYYEREVQFYKACVGIAGIPAMLATGITEGQKYIIADYVGTSLSVILATGRTISGQSMQLLARRLLVILQAIHARDFLHLSVAPDNILIDVSTSHVSLIDFKYSLNLSESQDRDVAQQRANKLLFTSSDQLHGQTPSFRCDLESLAYVLMYLHTGSLPWKATLRTEPHNTYMHRRRRFSHSEFLRDISEEYRELWIMATSLQPGEKPNYEKLKASFMTESDKIRLEERCRREFPNAAGPRGTSTGVAVPRISDKCSDTLDTRDLPSPSPRRDEARRSTTKKEGPQFTPSLRSLISHIREDY